jgi:hypothetical protein
MIKFSACPPWFPKRIDLQNYPNQTSFSFNSRKDMTKITNITPALIRKVNPPIELYKNPPKVSPTILARPPKLPAMPCTAP